MYHGEREGTDGSVVVVGERTFCDKAFFKTPSMVSLLERLEPPIRDLGATKRAAESPLP